MIRTTKYPFSLAAALAGVATLASLFAMAVPARAQGAAPKPDLAEVLVYPTRDDGSIMQWLAAAPLSYDSQFIGDSMSYDVFKREGGSELTVRPRAGDLVQGHPWHKMHFNGTTEGPTMCSLFDVGGGFDYGITVCYAYLYSPTDHPKALFSGSSDDALKVVLNGTKIWTNQIQRSPTYDSDQAPATIKKGWNSLLCVVDQVIGGHLLCARFLDNGQPINDLEISLDPPTPDAVRHPADEYNKQAADMIRQADTLKAAGKLTDACDAYKAVVAKYPLSDVAPRAAYTGATTLFSAAGDPSLNQPENAVKALNDLLNQYGQDLLAEYALLDVARIQAGALKDPAAAETTYRSFEDRFPRSSLAAKSVVELAHLLSDEKRYEDAILTYRKAIKKYPDSDEVMTATLGIADVYRLSGDKEKATQQYAAAKTMAADWHDNKYGIDVGKQAWLQGLLDYIRQQGG